MNKLKIIPEVAAGNIVPATPAKILFDIRAAAERLSLAPVTIRKLTRQGRLKTVPGVRKLLYTDATLNKFAAGEV